ncbi:tripartite tricarboxylate transporter TctB family protein [Roseovarius sp. EGI FJ00037]|uniref:tripartite tricarboxylate transporter TctB family protein n=1 Tax=Roseovarius salincola TaxID=2978479 RepID=UPI0022A871E7|nr:tripartite tricarboxylate transporter TctB family protein [Roseovarius sp. EGI FJ00037]MCZ0813329.1 tripartite tricarboxylate transporter TctB family protein [Roseovarius sp. EGI FJ00037]
MGYLQNNKLTVETMVWIVLATGGFVLTFDMTQESSNYRFGAAGWPRFVCVMIFLAAIIQFLVRTWHETHITQNTTDLNAHESHHAVHDAAHEVNEATNASHTRGRMKTLSIFLVPLVFVFSLNHIGFFVATPLLVWALLFALGERRALPLFLIGAGISVGVILFFTSLFYVPLPIGNMPGFYELNSWLVQALRL